MNNIILQPEQKQVLALDHQGPVMIKGVAGSGKSTVALFRAKYLIENYPNMFNESKAIIFTFNRVLADQLDVYKYQVSGGYDLENNTIDQNAKKGINVDVINFHRWAFRFLSNNGHDNIDVVKDKDARGFINSEVKTNRDWDLYSKDVDFLMDEISWIKGKAISTEEEYQVIERTGRGTSVRLSKNQREGVWNLLCSYNKFLSDNGKCDFDDFALKALAILERKRDFKGIKTNSLLVDDFMQKF